MNPIIAQCAWCKRVRLQSPGTATDSPWVHLTHGICPACAASLTASQADDSDLVTITIPGGPPEPGEPIPARPGVIRDLDDLMESGAEVRGDGVVITSDPAVAAQLIEKEKGQAA